ncbi:unnamed protein product [Macrosiphum euphorbiae]|uniref:Uncharacterized protein n=1 Tax=Macrosiphum euphorbiae TaxID=13131 RepID=A0AAV0Y6R8_9HEMI|nr:unnamed protein product [Macrosiphum euphorbiae]
MSREKFLEIMKNSGHQKLQYQIQTLQKEIEKRTGYGTDSQKLQISRMISRFQSEYKTRWEKAHRMEERFIKDNTNWLKSKVCLPSVTQQLGGRPKISFEESTERMKRQKTKDLRKSTSLPQLVFATQMKLRASGQTDTSKLVGEIVSDPSSAQKYINSYKQSIETKSMSGDDAVALIVDAQLSRHQYNIIRSKAPKIYPSYKIVQEAKKQCYPQPNKIYITETSVHVDLQTILDLTIDRLIITLKDVIHTLSSNELKKLCLISKWGFDGSSGHSSYKQAFYGIEADDSAVFITCIVPLRLQSGSKVVWQNPRPGSTRYCRPLKIAFMKENTRVSIDEKKRMDEQILNLEKSSILLDENTLVIKHNLTFTMIDGKVCNAVTGSTSTQKCYICNATCKDFNLIDEMIIRPIKMENLEFGISILHGWIRFFECLLHLAYKLPFKKWQARGSDKEIVAETKKKIQIEFKTKLGLIVDKPKPGFGNTNDGNTARRFFKNAEVSAEITNLDLDLIKKMHTILIVVSCGHDIDIEKFRKYALETAYYFVEKYPWYNMPPTLHKYLIHGPEIISHALLPIGQLTEEAQEARNKDFKKFREHHSRKCSRTKSNTDIFNFFLLSSDPVINSKRKLPQKKLSSLPKEAVDLLLPPSNHDINNDHEYDSEDDDDLDDDHDDDSDDNVDEDYENVDDTEDNDD